MFKCYILFNICIFITFFFYLNTIRPDGKAQKTVYLIVLYLFSCKVTIETVKCNEINICNLGAQKQS